MGSFQTVMNTPDITAESVITVPTDRSIPAVMITKVTPRASTQFTAVANRMPIMLSTSRKNGDASENPTNKTIRPANASIFCVASDWNREPKDLFWIGAVFVSMFKNS